MTSPQPAEFPVVYFPTYTSLLRNHFIFISPRTIMGSTSFLQILAFPSFQWTLPSGALRYVILLMTFPDILLTSNHLSIQSTSRYDRAAGGDEGEKILHTSTLGSP